MNIKAEMDAKFEYKTQLSKSLFVPFSGHGRIDKYGRKQSWAIEAMKRCDEVLNALLLQFLCQR
jgi:hypothetical protein